MPGTDPFSGRGTTVLQGLLMYRRVVATDINPVAYCISRTKAEVPKLKSVLSRIRSVEALYLREGANNKATERATLSMFFRRAFHHATLSELLFLRGVLDWEQDRVDRFITTLILGSLHGDMDRSSAYFSNQMPRTICLKPEYSLRYWKERSLYPKRRDVFAMLKEKAHLRLEQQVPPGLGLVARSDARAAAKRFPTCAEKSSSLSPRHRTLM